MSGGVKLDAAEMVGMTGKSPMGGGNGRHRRNDESRVTCSMASDFLALLQGAVPLEIKVDWGASGASGSIPRPL